MLVTCQKCGVENKDNDVFCTSCGAKIKSRKETQPTKDLRAARPHEVGGKKATIIALASIVSSVIFMYLVDVLDKFIDEILPFGGYINLVIIFSFYLFVVIGITHSLLEKFG